MAKKSAKQLKKLLQNKTVGTNTKGRSLPEVKSKTTDAELKELLQLVNANDQAGLHYPPVDEETFVGVLKDIKKHEAQFLPYRGAVETDESILQDYAETDQAFLQTAKAVGYGYFHEEDNEPGSVLLTTDFGMHLNIYQQPTLLAYYQKWFLKDTSVYDYVKRNLAEDFDQYCYQYPQEILQYALEAEKLAALRKELSKRGLLPQ